MALFMITTRRRKEEYDACIRRLIPYLLAFLVDTLARTGNKALKFSDYLISKSY